MAKTKQKAEVNEPAPQVEGSSVETTAAITALKMGKHEDAIEFTALHFAGKHDDQILREIITEASPVALIIDLPTPDPNLPLIRVEGYLTKFNMAKTCDKPTFKKVQFSSGQVSQIHGYIRDGEEIKLKIVQLQGELFKEEDASAEG
jgi:hypothetical protein